MSFEYFGVPSRRHERVGDSGGAKTNVARSRPALSPSYIREKERAGIDAAGVPAGATGFFFALTTNNTFYILLIHVFFYVLYAVAWSMLLHIDAVASAIFTYNFNAAFSPVVFVMQGLYLKSLYDDTKSGYLFFQLMLETRSLALKLGAYVYDARARAADIGNMRTEVVGRGGDLFTRHINVARGLLMVYTRYHFMLFGVADVNSDYERFNFGAEESAADAAFVDVRMNGEHVTSVLDGAQYELIRALTQLRVQGVLTSDMYSELNTKIDALASIKDQMWMMQRPLGAPILDTIPKMMLAFYVYLLIPLGTFSTVGRFWGIFIYATILFFYNGRNVLASWLGSAFSPRAHYHPISFNDLRGQQYLMIEHLLGDRRNIAPIRDTLDDPVIFYPRST